MKTRAPTLARRGVLAALLVATATSGILPGHAQDAGAGAAAESAEVVDAPLPAYRAELLELALESAARLPLEPHIKNRARALEQVVEACLELDQPRRALACAEQIPNWRRGAGYAAYALWCARHGAGDEARRYIDRAGRIADQEAADEMSQDWRVHNIRARMAEAWLALGDPSRAADLRAGLGDSEVGRLDAALARELDAEAVETQLTALATVAQGGSFEQVRNALVGCAQLFDRFYADSERRDLVEQEIKAAWRSMPTGIRIELLLELARFALDHSDPAKALALLDEAERMRAGSDWTPEAEIPTLARLGEMRFRAGDEAGARRALAAALGLYEERGESIIDIFRAEALRPLAEAFHAMGVRAGAHDVYARALEAGVHNPNSRPRAEDLTATCLSMARVGFEPDAELWERMVAIGAALAAPW